MPSNLSSAQPEGVASAAREDLLQSRPPLAHKARPAASQPAIGSYSGVMGRGDEAKRICLLIKSGTDQIYKSPVLSH